MLEKDAMDILMKFLDKKTREAEEEVTQRGVLSDDKAIPLMLKSQFNHIAHLEKTIDQRFERVDKQFDKVDKRFEQVDARLDRLEHRVFGGFAIMGFLVTFFGSLTAVMLHWAR